MNKKPSLKNKDIADVLNGETWPHVPRGSQWKTHSDSFPRLCRMVKRMSELGLPAHEAVAMLSELYWCAYGDVEAMPKPAPKDDGPGVRYFDEYQIMFSLHAAELTADELKAGYKFYCNLYARNGTVWWGNPGGGAGGGPLYSFLNTVKGDNNYAFGPTKTQKGWSAERLAKVNAVGVYKKIEPPVRLGRQGTTALTSARRKK